MSLYLLWMLWSKVLVHSFNWVRLAKDKFRWWKLHPISNSFVQMYFLFWSCNDCSFVIVSSECNAAGVMSSSPLCDILHHTVVVFILLHKFSQMWTNLLAFYLNLPWQTFCNMKEYKYWVLVSVLALQHGPWCGRLGAIAAWRESLSEWAAEDTTLQVVWQMGCSCDKERGQIISSH